MMSTLRRASVADTAKVALAVVGPMLAQGVIRRRPRVVRLAQRLDLDHRSAALMRRLRARYGDGPLRLAIPGRSFALVLATGDVERLLRGSPEPFALAATEKRAALRHFQPDGVLITRGEPRAPRRIFNERVLDAHAPLHRQAGAIVATIEDEVRRMPLGTVLDWPVFSTAFARIVRRVTLGESARDDVRLTAELDRLRDAANWAYLRPRQEGLRQRFQRRVDAYVARAEPGSLAGMMAGVPAAGGVAPSGQVPHWLFAFDAAAITTFRTLALLGSEPDRAAIAAAEAQRADGPDELPYLRACVQETLRLWPTTLTVLRESTRDTDWGGPTLPARTTFIIMSAYFHRDPAMHFADSFAPEVWLSGAHRRGWSVLPFSGGPGECPGRELVLLVTTTVLAALLRGNRFEAARPLRAPLPGTLEQTAVTLRVSSASG
jgi:cytochrome P450